jgi:hypothetical protein
MKTEVPTIEKEIAQLEARRAEVTREVEAAQFRITTARQTVIADSNSGNRQDLVSAQAEAGALETVVTELTRRRDFLGRELKKAREDEQRAEIEREVIARSERLFAADAKSADEEAIFAEMLESLQTLYRRRVAQGEELASLQNFAAQNGVNSFDFPAFASLKSDSPAAILRRAMENLTGTTPHKSGVAAMFEVEARTLSSERDKVWRANFEASKAEGAAKAAASRAHRAEVEKRDDEANRQRYTAGARDSMAQAANLKWEQQQMKGVKSSYTHDEKIDQLSHIGRV